MTKIYLVKVNYKFESGWETTINLQVFTNKKLANIYLEYKKLKRKQNPKKDAEVSYELEEFEISKLDWSEELLELQMKELPY